jgi:magnesium transporter
VHSTRASFVTIPISIVIKDDVIITTSLYKNPVIDSIINQNKKLSNPDITTFVLNLFDQNINFYLYYLKQINIKFNDFEKTIDKAASNSDFVKILHLQKSLIFFETSLRANNLMLVKMKRTNFLNTRQNEDNDDFFEEIIVENHQAIEMTEVYSRILDSSMQTISSIISNNVNMVMKRLTGITMVLIVPSIISGLWGMNVPLPLANNPFGFIILSFSALLMVIFISLFFIRKNWL